jgi:hypothetical protein
MLDESILGRILHWLLAKVEDDLVDLSVIVAPHPRFPIVHSDAFRQALLAGRLEFDIQHSSVIQTAEQVHAWNPHGWIFDFNPGRDRAAAGQSAQEASGRPFEELL